jgi:hypothetical protein
MWWGLAVIGLCACGRLDFDPLIDASSEPLPACSPWQGSWTAEPPTVFLELTGYTHSPSLSPDCHTLYYARGGDLRQMSRPALDQPFGAEVFVADLSDGAVTDLGVVLGGPDLLEAFVARVGGIWRATRGSPADAFAVVAPIGHDGLDINISSDGLRIYFERSMADDIHVAERAAIGMPFGASRPVPGLDLSTAWEHGAYVTPDELFAITGRGTGGADLDLWMLARPSRSTPFVDIGKLDPLNQPGITESHTWLCPHTCELFYISEGAAPDTRLMRTRLIPL